MSKEKLGLIYATCAYGLWGLFPLYWPYLAQANALEIVSHRAVWSLIFCALILGFTKSIRATFSLLSDGKVALRLFFAAIFVSANWLIFIWAVNHGHVVEASLGYYINPIFMIAFGILFLREKMRPLQWITTCIAFLGVLVLTIDYGRLPWVAFGLALSWGSYSYVKKKLGLNALQGLAIETAILSLPYLAYIIYLGEKGTGQFAHGISITLLLIGSGVVTAVPLLFFNAAATRLPFTTIGLIQFVTPTLLFAIGVWINHEEMSAGRWAGFFIIWVALIALALDLLRSSRTLSNSVDK